MSSSNRAATVGAVAALVALSLAQCSPGPKRCEQYSDCDPGLTCAYGRCVYPPAPDAGDGAAPQDDASDTTPDDAASASDDASVDASDAANAANAGDGSATDASSD